jgi:chromosomal replication initiation ATPase DnaA
MTLKHIQNYLSRAGKSVVHSTIIYGINKIKEQMVHDDDLRKVVLDLMEDNNGL